MSLLLALLLAATDSRTSLADAGTHASTGTDAGVATHAARTEAGARDGGVALRLRAVGDVMLGSTFPAGQLAPDDGATSLDAVKALLEDADVTFVNLEGPLCDGGETTKCGKKSKPGSCYAFRSPTKYAAYLKAAGVDVASTANNHAGDFGDVCRRQTEQTLDTVGIRWSGAPGTIASLNANGQRVAVVAFHTSAAVNNVNDHPAAAALVKKAALAHDLVIVSFHGGAEGGKALHVPKGREVFFGENRGDLRAFARLVIDAGADAVLGHGPHVARGMEVYKDRLIAYSMGNFATYGQFNLSGPQGLGMVLELQLAADGKLVEGRIIATKQVGRGTPELDPKGSVVKQVRELSEADFKATQPEISPDGVIRRRVRGP